MDYCAPVSKIDIKKSSQEDYNDHLKKPDTIYQITHTVKGAVLVVNNSFSDSENERHGSATDVKNVVDLFTKLSCQVQVRHEFTADVIMETFQEFSSSEIACNSDFVAVVIMSHGGEKHGEDVFYDKDMKLIYVKDALALFTDINAKKLRGIPKFFFFQICRGSSTYQGTLCPNRGVQVDSISVHENEKSAHPSREGPPVGLRDMMMSFATQPGFVASRNAHFGSWYTTTFVNVFSNHAHNSSVVNMMTMVNCAMANNQNQYRGKVPVFTSTLTKELYFFPGFPHGERVPEPVWNGSEPRGAPLVQTGVHASNQGHGAGRDMISNTTNNYNNSPWAIFVFVAVVVAVLSFLYNNHA